MVDKIYITWDNFHQDVKNLSKNIKLLGHFNKIVAVSRGGLIPAGIMSYELGIRDVEVINISSYDEDIQRCGEDVKLSTCVSTVDEKTLIVDDLSDTGNTFNIIRKLFPEGKYAAVYAKPLGINSVDIYEKAIPDKWVVFPWD